MENRIVTLAIHTKGKALVLKQVLEGRGIKVFTEELKQTDNPEKNHDGIAVRIYESQLSAALIIIEEHKLFSYGNEQTYRIDDGRKRILVAVDFSSYSMKACQVAFNVAKEINAKVKILHVYHNLYFPTTLPFADKLKEEGEPDILDKSRRKMLDLCMEIDKKISEDKFPSVNYSYSLREGLVEEEIESFIKEYKPILLFLGTKGKSNNRNNVLGSVSADIIEMTDIPVMAVPENSPIEKITDMRHIAFFTNLNERDLISFDYLAGFLLRYEGLKITLVHVIAGNKKKVQWMESGLLDLKEFFNKKYPTLNVECKLIIGDNVVPDIKDFINKEDVNIVTVNTRRRNILGRIFIPSVSRKMLASFDVTILALRGEKLLKLKDKI